MTEKETLQLQALCGKLLDKTISADEMRLLERLLAADEEARRYYVRVSGLASSLQHYAAEFQSSEDTARALDEEIIAEFPQPNRWPRSARLALAAAAALVALSGIASVIFWQQGASRNSGGNGAGGEIASATDEGVAILTRSTGLEWTANGPHGAYRPGDRISPGKLRLKAGLAQIEFYSGATLLIEGPVELDIESDNKVRCLSGRIRAHVPPQAIGFEVLTPDYQLIDLGTDFGVSIGPDGESEVHVFDGEVELHGLAGHEGARKLIEGEAIQLRKAREEASLPENPSAFPVPAALDQDLASAEIRYRQWQAFSDALKEDKHLLAYYRFEPATPWDRTLSNDGQLDEPGLNGAIVGCQWTDGRWPLKRALDFKSPADRVRLQLPGNFNSITEVAWVRIDGLDRKWNSLLLTDNWNKGYPHWQFAQSGELILGLGGEKDEQGNNQGQNFFSEPLIDFELLGRWTLLAVVVDGKAHEVRHYLNGDLVKALPIENPSDHLPLTFGAMELGNYRPAEVRGVWDVRNFNGRIDEFMIFDRPLKDDEIARIYEIGRPDAAVKTP